MGETTFKIEVQLVVPNVSAEASDSVLHEAQA